jgi:hypothetical protein
LAFVARESRDFIAHDDADLAQADVRGQLLEAITANRVGGGPPLVPLDERDLMLLPAQVEQTLAKGTLVEAALAILLDLFGIGLPDVDNPLPFEMSRLDLRRTVHAPPPR